MAETEAEILKNDHGAQSNARRLKRGGMLRREGLYSNSIDMLDPATVRWTPGRDEIVRLYSTGMTMRDIAATLGVSPHTVKNTLNTPTAQDQLEQLKAHKDARIATITDQISLVLVESTLEAVKDLRKILNDPNTTTSERIRASAALCNIGVAKTININKSEKDDRLSDEELEQLKARARSNAGFVNSGTLALVPNKE